MKRAGRTPKQRVIKRFQSARSVRRPYGFYVGPLWAIFNGENRPSIGGGDTAAAAWADAERRL